MVSETERAVMPGCVRGPGAQGLEPGITNREGMRGHIWREGVGGRDTQERGGKYSSNRTFKYA